ncbi:MAG: glutaredoxin family protein [Mariprofundaceae bacterium]|nr:glutaredoxin family protein [Mariprofundaceae bacterium]
MTRKACCLCEEAELALETLVQAGICEVQVCDVDAEPMWAAHYGRDVPVLLINGNICLKHHIKKESVLALLK